MKPSVRTSSMWDQFDELPPKEKGNRFEDLCFDLLVELGFRVDRQSFNGRGGSDGGQDLVISEPDPQSGELSPTCVVECKFRSSSTITGADIWSPLLAVLELNVPSLLIMTSQELTGPLKARLRSISCNSQWGISIRKIERQHLEALVNQHPRIKVRHFPGVKNDKGGSAESADRTEPIVADLKAATRIHSNGTRKLQVTLYNAEAQSRSVKIVTAEGEASEELDPFQEKTVELSIEADAKGDQVAVRDGKSGNTLQTLCTDPPAVSVTHIFVDPFGYVSKISDALDGRMTTLISGKAGSGKSRIISEVLQRYESSRRIDLAQNSRDIGLIEIVLELIFALQIQEIRALTPLAVTTFLNAQSDLSNDAVEALSLYILQHKQADRGFAEACAKLCSSCLRDHVIAIDNIHRLSLFDLDFLKALTTQTKIRLLLAARPSEADIRNAETLNFIRQSESTDWTTVAIDEAETHSLLTTYIEQASADERTRCFLRPWTNIDSVQKFALALKKLKAANVLEQDLNGQLTVHSVKGAHPSQQREVFAEIKSLLAGMGGPEIVDRTLAAASIFGYHFPVEFVTSVVGEDARSVLDTLEQAEIISLSESIDGELWMRFDHETTARIAVALVPSLEANRLHRQVLDYLLDPARYDEGRDDRKVGEHYGEIGYFREAARRFHNYGVYQAKRGRYSDSLSTYKEAKGALDQCQDGDDDERLRLEIQIIHDFLEAALIGTEAFQTRWTMLSSYQLALRLLGEEQSGRHAGRYWFFRANMEREIDPAAAEKSMIRSLEVFGDDYGRDRAEAHAWFSNFLKRSGRQRFSEAVDHARRALSITRRIQEPSLRSRCLLHTGALFLEVGRAGKTPWWWQRAVDVLSGSKDIGMLAFALSDLAYINALVRPRSIDARLSLLEALALADQFDLHRIKLRCTLNLANWAYFHGDEPTDAVALLDSADQLLKSTPDEHLAALLDFSKLNFTRLQNAWPMETIRERNIAFLVRWFADHEKAIDGDRRVQNMLRFHADNREEKILEIIERAQGAEDRFKERGAFSGEISDNWYYLNDSKSYVTYY